MGDLDASDPWDKCRRTPGYWWRCSVPGSENLGIAILMTVSADRVAEVSTWPSAKGPCDRPARNHRELPRDLQPHRPAVLDEVLVGIMSGVDARLGSRQREKP